MLDGADGTSVILCVCPSPALDVTYEVPDLDVGGTNRVRQAAQRPGGKAVNVARVLTSIGEPAVVLAPVGGAGGAEFRSALSAAGVAVETVEAGAPTRRTVTVVEGTTGRATVLAEPSRVDSWDAVADRFAELLPDAAAVVVSGSMPTGAPPDALAELARSCRRAGRPVIVDTSGAALAAALAGQPTVIKPNADELARTRRRRRTGGGGPRTGRPARRHRGRLTGPRRAGGGRRRRRLAGPAGRRTAPAIQPAPATPSSPGWPAGWSAGRHLPDLLVDAVALSAAAVLQPYAGDVDLGEVERQRAGVLVERLAGRSGQSGGQQAQRERWEPVR